MESLIQKLGKAIKELPASDKWLIGVAGGILFNQDLALCIAALIFVYFAWKIGKEVSKP